MHRMQILPLSLLSHMAGQSEGKVIKQSSVKQILSRLGIHGFGTTGISS